MQTAGKAVAIITARGGSKRIPHKNIKEFCGKPILAYSIEAALASGVFDRVMVSTDDEEIAEVARKYGAEVPFLRSEKTANDYATTKDVLEEVLAEYEKRGTSVAETWSLNGSALESAPKIIEYKRCERFALDILCNDNKLLARLNKLFKKRKDFLNRGDFLICNKNIWIVVNSFHFFGIRYHVW